MNTYTPDRVIVLSIWAEDVPTTAHFYKDVLGLELFPRTWVSLSS